MPCNSDYLASSCKEREHRRAARLLLYVLRTTRQEIPAWLHLEVDNLYAKDERTIPVLCAVLAHASPAVLEEVVYNARNKTARDLANWWEDHQEADRTREEQEKQAVEREQLRTQALSKLSLEERTALNVTS